MDVRYQTIHVVIEDKNAPYFLKKKRMAFKEIGRITAAYIVEDNQIFVGFAFCAPKDLKQNLYRRNKGRVIALAKLTHARLDGWPLFPFNGVHSIDPTKSINYQIKEMALVDGYIREIGWMKKIQIGNVVSPRNVLGT